MIINGKQLILKDLSREQIQKVDDALEAVFFKESHLFIRGEPFAPSFRRNKKHFKQVISLLISFKRALMKFFQSQYENRYNLVRINGAKLAEDDEEDDGAYLYLDNWPYSDEELAKILEEYKRKAYELGVSALVEQSNKDIKHNSYDAGAVFSVKKIKVTATTMNEVTKKRVRQAIQDSIDLGETKEQLEERLKKIFVNPFRGRFVAQQEAIQSYREGKATAAKESKQFTKKTWGGVQPDKKEICGKVIGETVGINDKFSNGLSDPNDTHYGCKCDLTYS